MQHKPLISVSVPVLNEEANLEALYERLSAVADKLSDRCNLEFVFTDNRSTDDTWKVLNQLASKDPRIKAMRFTRNYGFQRSILANYLNTRGDAVMQIDADLQDPPEMLEQFFDKWQAGDKVVYGVRRKREEGVIISAIRRAGYWCIDLLSEHPIPRDVGDFRLVDRKVIEIIAKTRTPSPYLRGMIAGLGFQESGVVYDRASRNAGQSKFNLPRLLALGLTAVFNHSTVPLRAATFLGIVILAVSMLGTGYYVALKIFDTNLPAGFASTQIMVLFGIGLNAFLLGIIGEYLLRIYKILRSEPLFTVAETINIEDKEIRY